MSDLSNILNPDGGSKRTVKLFLNMKKYASTSDLPSTSTANTFPKDSNNTPHSSLREWKYEDNLAREHKEHPDCPDTLACLPDTDGRPQHTLPVILRCAILGSSRKRLTIREIYAAMEAKYPYYTTAGPTWKQSVRHHLSLNRLFERQPRPVTDPGFGSYWTVNLSAPPGTKRPRKRGRNNKDIVDGEAPAPKKRGRPRKISRSTPPAREITPPSPTLSPISSGQSPASPALSPALPALLPPLLQYEREFQENKFALVPDNGRCSSEDDYESEEELVRPYDRRNSLTGLTPYFLSPHPPPQTYSLPPFSALDQCTGNQVSRLQMEVANLRRQSAEAVSNSLRLSEQLAQAQSEALRSRSELRNMEEMLEEEFALRKEKEKLANEESLKRRAAEEALNKILTPIDRRAHPLP